MKYFDVGKSIENTFLLKVSVPRYLCYVLTNIKIEIKIWVRLLKLPNLIFYSCQVVSIVSDQGAA